MREPADRVKTEDRYSFAEAARAVNAKPNSVRNWFRGYKRGRRLYDPVLPRIGSARPVHDRISFLELCEAKIVAASRAAGFSMQRIRNARQFARAHLGLEYPLATRQFKTDGSRLLFKFEQSQREEQAGRPDGLMFVDIGDDAAQTTLPDYIRDAVDLFDFAERGEWVSEFYPRGKDVPLSIDPTYRSGQVTVARRGVTPEMIFGRHLAGESLEFLAEDLDLDLAEIQAALAYFNTDMQ